MLFDLWDIYQQSQIEASTSLAERAKKDVDETSSRLQNESARLEAKIDALALVCQSLWELIKEKTDLTEEDIEKKMAEIDLRDGREDGRMTGTVEKCPSCQRPAHSTQRICMYCATPIIHGHLTERPTRKPAPKPLKR